MSKFNIGDKVRCIYSEEGYWYQIGDILTINSEPVFKASEGDYVYQVKEKDSFAYIGEDEFELVKEEAKVKEFDLHKDKWFIRTPTPEISEAVQLWLFEQGIYWVGSRPNNVQATDSKMLTNLKYRSTTSFVKGKFMHDSGPIELEYYPPELEIKFTFKTLIDTVEYPKPEIIETESQKELRILKEQIEQLTQQANKLETTLKGEV